MGTRGRPGIAGWFAAALLFGTACQPANPPLAGQTTRLSECGGFAAKGDALYGGNEAYCDAELLHWRYDPTSRVFTLADTRVLLNCCGRRSLRADSEDGLYRFTERDQRDGPRCRCQCVFDFAIDLEGVAEGELSFKLFREVEEEPSGPRLILEETVDLTVGEGFFVLDDTDVGPFCTPL